MQKLLSNKVVVITGGAGLIGQEFVRGILAQDAIAIVADVNEQTANSFIEGIKLESPQARVDFVEVDITFKESLTNMISSLHEKYGRIDALVNNAYPRNQNYGKKFEEVAYEDFCQNVSLHLGGYFLTAQQVAAYFKTQGHGTIINMASIYGVVAPRFGIYDQTKMTMPVEYAVIKSAIIHLTKYMAKYFKGMNIRVNTLSPGGILDKQPAAFLEAYSEQCLNKGMLDKSDLCGTLVYLLSDLSAHVNGQNIVVDDGFSL